MDCPFKYAAEKIFFVGEEIPIDREVSPLSMGSVVHKLFEVCFKKISRP